MEVKDLFIFNTISNIGKVVLFINVILYLKSYRKKSIAFKVFTNYLLFILVIELITGYMRSIKEPNLYLSHFYFVGQFLFMSFFYLFLEKKNLFKKGIKIMLFLVLIAIAIYYLKYPEDYFKFNPFEIAVTSIPLIIYSFYFFVKNIDGKDKKFIYINSGFFLYLSCSTLLFVAGNLENTSMKMIIWYSNVILYLVYQILVFVEWYKNFRKPVILPQN